MADSGETKDDVKFPEGDVGEKIDKLFRVEEKDTSKFSWRVEFRIGELIGTDVIVLTSMGEEVAIEAKEAPRS